MGYSTTSFTALLIAYVLLCFGGVYFCMLADPNTSNMAELMQITIPTKIWNRLFSMFGKEKMSVLQHVMDRALVLVYFAVVGGSWSIVWWYLYPWLYASPGVNNIHGIIGGAVFLACFVSWGLANSSFPGRITAKTFARYDHYAYDNLLFLPDKRCETTKLLKIPRSKFDRIKYNCIVPRYDHFCGWVSTVLPKSGSEAVCCPTMGGKTMALSHSPCFLFSSLSLTDLQHLWGRKLSMVPPLFSTARDNVLLWELCMLLIVCQ